MPPVSSPQAQPPLSNHSLYSNINPSHSNSVPQSPSPLSPPTTFHEKTSRGTPGLAITILTLEAGQQTTWACSLLTTPQYSQHRPQIRRHTRSTHRPRRVACLPRPHGTHTLFLSRAFTPHFLTYLSSYNSRSSSPPKTRISQITVCLSHASSTSEFFCHDNCASGSHWCWMCEEPTQ
jgi:hypothetical protein